MCIRRHLDKESTCPACRVATSTAQMRRNVVLDEIANSFKDCRSQLLNTLVECIEMKGMRALSQSQSQSQCAESMEVDDAAPNYKRRRTSARVTRSSPKTRGTGSQDPNDMSMDLSLQDDNDKDSDFVDLPQVSAFTHKGKGAARTSGSYPTPPQRPALRSRTLRSSEAMVVPESPPPQHQQPQSSSAPQGIVSSTSTDLPIRTSTISQSNSIDTSISSPTQIALPEPTKPPTLVECPVCQYAVPEAYANIHLDKFCLQGKMDPNYTIPFRLIITQTPAVMALYERQGTSKRDVISAVPLSTNMTDTPSATTATTVGPAASVTRSTSIHTHTNVNGSSNFQVFEPRAGSPTHNRTIQVLPSKSASKPVMTYPEPKRIPKLTYSVLNDKQLRKKLQELGIPSHGDKELMRKRHAEYVTIYNANCDATRPQSPAQLMKALEVWERAYEQDLIAREEQKKVLDHQRLQQQEFAQQAANSATLPSSLPNSQNATSTASSSSTGFVPNQANSNELAVSIASASAFAHAAKYADEYADLIADVKKRMQADKDKALADKKDQDPHKRQNENS
ncbi:E3 ubiquitin-protein ligase rad18 [Mortierella claussenii]|nr:E3 ubiquitin-protein ligase rad18 [Mortierella claussenii]